MENPAPVPLGDRLQALALRGLIGGLLRLPYRLRVPLCGWVVSRLIAPVAGWRRRIRANLALIRPAMPPAEVQAITRAVPDNFGRTIIETWSGAEFAARAAAQPPFTLFILFIQKDRIDLAEYGDRRSSHLHPRPVGHQRGKDPVGRKAFNHVHQGRNGARQKTSCAHHVGAAYTAAANKTNILAVGDFYNHPSGRDGSDQITGQ